MNKVFVFGSLNMDFIFNVNRLPEVGETMVGNGYRSYPGGKGSNQAVAAAKQGIITYMIGSVGNDVLAKELIDSLDQFNVRSDYVKQLYDQTTGLAFIIVNKGDNRIIIEPGANAVHDSSVVENILKENANAGDVLLLQLEIPVKNIVNAIKIAVSLKMYIVFNAAPMKKFDLNILKDIDLLIVNEIEAKSLSGIEVNQYNVDQVLKTLIKFGLGEVLLTLGHKGSYYSNGKDVIYTRAYQVPVIDTTGAGDSFIGTFIANRLNHLDLATSLKRASVSAAITIQTMGAQNSMPDERMIDEFLKSRKDL